MIDPKQIPDEVVNELFLRDAWRGSVSQARAAIAACLAAWPGAEVKPTHLGYPAWPHLILPLPQEGRDA